MRYFLFPVFLVFLLCCGGTTAAKLGSLRSSFTNLLSRSNILLKIPQNQAPITSSSLLKSYLGKTIEKSVETLNKQQHILKDLRTVADDTFQFAKSFYQMTNQGMVANNYDITDLAIQWMLKYPKTVQLGFSSYTLYSFYRWVSECADCIVSREVSVMLLLILILILIVIVIVIVMLMLESDREIIFLWYTRIYDYLLLHCLLDDITLPTCPLFCSLFSSFST